MMNGYLDFVNDSRTEASGWIYLGPDETVPAIIARLNGHEFGQPSYGLPRDDVTKITARPTCTFKIHFTSPLPIIAIVGGLLEVAVIGDDGIETPVPISSGCLDREQNSISAALRHTCLGANSPTNAVTAPNNDKETAHNPSWADLEIARLELARQISNIPKLVSDTVGPLLDAASHRLTIAGIRQTRQIEAVLQLAPYIPDSPQLMPSTGGFALDARSLLHLLKLVETERPAHILEFGSGTSTVWLGHLLKAYGGTLRSLEHSQQYYEATLADITLHNLHGTVDLRFAPLEDIEIARSPYRWYESKQYRDFEQIDMVLVDGPPESTGEYARFPGYPTVRDQLSDRAIVMLHDLNRTAESAIAQLWITQDTRLTSRDTTSSDFAVFDYLSR